MEVVTVQTKYSGVINAALLIIIGVLFILDKDLALNIGFILAGVFLIISGIVPMIMCKTIDLMGVLMIILGIILILVPYVFTTIALIILGVIAIIVGAAVILGATKESDGKVRAVAVIVGALIIIAGISIMLQMDIAFILFGVFLLIAGILNLVTVLKTN
jgi:uncharacterized membrane protein HdeD (DUF308 family)